MKRGFDNRIKKPKLTVVFLHGIAATSGTWSTTVRNFAKDPSLKDVRLITLDLLGFGGSLKADWLDYDFFDYEIALKNTLKKMHIKSPIILVGHSMGSLIAADYAKKNRVQIAELILVSPPVLMSDELAKLPDKFYLKSYSSIHKIADDPAIKTLANFVQKVSNFRAEYLRTTAFRRSMDNVILNPHNFKTFTSLKTPTTIIHGKFDALVMRPNLVKAVTENSRYLTLHRVLGQHDISPKKRDKIVITLRNFLEK